MSNIEKSTLVGQLFFYATLATSLAFFWWLLIYDHGVSAHSLGN